MNTVGGVWIFDLVGSSSFIQGMDEHVTVIHGRNGSGKTTILNTIRDLIEGNVNSINFNLFSSAEIRVNLDENNYVDHKAVSKGEIVTHKSTKNVPYLTPRIEYVHELKSDEMYISKLNASLTDYFISILREHCTIYDKVITDVLMTTLYIPEQLENIESKSESSLDLSSDMCKFFKQLLNPILRKAEQDKFFLYSGINMLQDAINKRLFNKTIKFTENGVIITSLKGDEITKESMSSGEKRIIEIFCKAFFMKEGIMLIDCPERSLDVANVENIISDLIELNPNVQYIITTNSPEICADADDSKIIAISFN